MPNITRAETNKTIAITQQGDSVSPNSHVILSADQSENLSWQVYIDSINNWVSISGQNAQTIELTPAMLLSLVNFKDGEVEIRAKSGELVSDTQKIPIYTEENTQIQNATTKKAPQSKGLLSTDFGQTSLLGEGSGTRGEGGEEALTYNIVINYTFPNGELAADPFLATIDAGESFNDSILIPLLPGYDAFLNGEEATTVDINITSIDRNYTYNVVYHPGQVTYVVEHYLQNAEDDNYSFAYSETLTGYTLDEVGNVEGDFTGFYPLLYEHPYIAADGSTVVQVYYDRYYYLMEFRLEGGSGVDPIYARYGTPVTISNPSRNGYAFTGWDDDPPSVMPIGGGTYTAQWTPANTTFNVLFWYENTTGTDKYSIVGSEELNGVTGTILDPEDYKNDTFEGRDDIHFVYNPNKTETVTLNGDGTTMVNVYFDRVMITFNFYDEALASSQARQSNTNLYYTMTGRWGSTFSQNNVTWPSEKAWSFWRQDGNNSSMGMTFMDAFLPTSAMGTATTINFYTRTVSGNTIYFLKERPDGTYATDESFQTSYLDTAADDKVPIATNSSFTFSEKYEGFSLKDYQTSGTNYNWTYTQNGTTHTYVGSRYTTTTSTTESPQYGVVDGELVELEYTSPRVWYLPYTYTQTTATTGTLYGIVESEYTRLTAQNSWIYDGDQTYNGAYVYRATTASTTGTQYYGVVNGSVVPVSVTQNYFYGENNENQYTENYKYRIADPINNGSYGTYYYMNNNQMTSGRLYYNNGTWYRTRSGNAWAGYSYSNPVDTAYTRSNTSTYDTTYQYYGVVNNQIVPLTPLTRFMYNNQVFEGTHYTRTNTPSTSTGTIDYYGFVDGEMKPLTFESGFTDEWGNTYNGQRYTRATNSSSNAYTGTRYVRANNSMPYTYKRIETNSGTQYGLDSNMGHQRLNYTNSTGNFYYNGERYIGTRYIQTGATTGTSYAFIDGIRYTLSRGSSYTGFGDSGWKPASVGGQISGSTDSIIRYERNSYKLEFYNHSYFLDNDEKSVKYEYSLADYDFIPEYPYSLPYGMYEFVGWYDNQELLGEPFDFENEVMPANNVTLYAKYEPLTLTVNVYKDLYSMTNGTDLLSTEDVYYGNLATPPDVPENEEYTFVGWFYQNRYGEEMPFQFSSMEVTHDLNIYGKWTSEVLVPYTIHYETEDGTPVSDDIVNSALAASTKTFLAKTDRQLYEDYRTHWFPTVSSHSILMQENVPNEYTFVYLYRDSVPYTVRYISEETGAELYPPKTVSDNIYLNVTERYQPIEGFVPDAFKKSLTLSVNGTNEIIFYYHEDDIRAPYVVNYYIETDDGYELYNYRNNTGMIGSTITAPELTISGYEFNPNASGTLTSGTLTANGLELNLYYDRTTYPYKVRYLERNTNRVLAEELTGRGYYEQQLTFNAIDITGYDLVGSDTQTLTIALEETDTPRNNVVTFYYRVQQAEIHYQPVGPGTVDTEVEYVSMFGTPTGSVPTANEGAEFVGWFTDAECTIPVTNGEINTNGHLTPGKNNQEQNFSATYYALFRVNAHSLSVSKTVRGSMGSRTEQFEFVLTITGEHANATGITYTKGQSTGSVTLTNGSYTFNLAHGESIVFENVPHGSVYNITETIANTHGYVTTVQGDDTGTLEADASVAFLNARNVAIPTDTFDKNIPMGLLFLVLLVVGVGAFFIHAKKKATDDKNDIS